MPQLDANARLRHVLEAGEAIDSFVRSATFADYEGSAVMRSAVEREFTIIGEALRQAAKLEPKLEIEISDFRRICDFRNVLVHDYVTVYNEAVWRIIHEDLPRLLVEVRALLPPAWRTGQVPASSPFEHPMPDAQRIVVIDDNGNDLQVIRRFLERKGFIVSAATSGANGLDIAQSITPDAFVVDYRMPGMDGFEVTRRIKSDPMLKTIPVLMLTGADSAQNVVDGLGAGADDFVTKGSDTEILLARLRALLRVKAYQDQLRKLNQQITRDLQIARRVQESLVPHGAFDTPHTEIRSAYIPSEELSGDFYDYFLQGDLLYLFVADVSGHGLPAAILVSLLKSYIRTESDASTPLSEFMSRLNDFLFSVSLPTQFATAQLFRIDAAGNLTYSNAAHPPFILFDRSDGHASVFEQPSHLLGAMPAMPFEEHSMTVGAGDTLFVYTDGLTDRRKQDGEFYSIDRIAALIEKAPDADVESLYGSIYDDVAAFPATDEFKDDIAFVVTRFR